MVAQAVPVLQQQDAVCVEAIEAIVCRLDALGSQALFWESGDQPQREIDFIRTHTGLTEYLSLGPTYGTKLWRELGVFLRPSTMLSERFQEQYKAEMQGEFASSPHWTDSLKRD